VPLHGQSPSDALMSVLDGDAAELGVTGWADVGLDLGCPHADTRAALDGLACLALSRVFTLRRDILEAGRAIGPAGIFTVLDPCRPAPSWFDDGAAFPPNTWSGREKITAASGRMATLGTSGKALEGRLTLITESDHRLFAPTFGIMERHSVARRSDFALRVRCCTRLRCSS